MNQSANLEFFATTAKGMESLLLQEIEQLGGQTPQKVRAGVTFKGSLETAYRACLWSRIANRILFPLKTFPAPDPDKLYAGIRSIHWTQHLSENKTLAVDFSLSNSKITHSHFAALRVKDAIVDQFRAVRGARPSVQTVKPDIQINVYLNQDIATVSLDLSGDSLHKRGYRTDLSPAPLKENLAAALLMTAGWPGKENDPIAFLDPMCGSGTLPIEAALMKGNIAPGLYRDYFGFLGWAKHDAALWEKLKKEAQNAIVFSPTPSPTSASPASRLRKTPKIIGYDRDFRSVRYALANRDRIDLIRNKVHFEKREILQCEPPAPKGILIVNPPYGERLGEVNELRGLYKQLGDIFKQRFKGWEAYIFTGNSELAKSVGLKASRRFEFYNGPIECRLLKYELY